MGWIWPTSHSLLIPQIHHCWINGHYENILYNVFLLFWNDAVAIVIIITFIIIIITEAGHRFSNIRAARLGEFRQWYHFLCWIICYGVTGVLPATGNSGSYSEIDCINHILEIRYKRESISVSWIIWHFMRCSIVLVHWVTSSKREWHSANTLYCQKIIVKFSDYYFGWEVLLFCLCLPFPRVPSLPSPAERKSIFHFAQVEGEITMD